MIQTLALQYFRNYTSHTFTFNQPTTIIVGPNAIGKTSIIEAAHLLSTGQSFRAGRVDEMIQFQQELGRIKAKITTPKAVLANEEATYEGESGTAEETELEVLLTRGEVQGKRTLKTLYSVNGVRRRKKDFIGHFFTVVFRPEDMRLVEGSPSRRRQFLDTPLATLSSEYARSLSTYEQTLKRRNKLLEQVREGTSPETTLAYWNMSLIKHGEVLQQHRQAFLYSFQTVEFPLPFSVDYQPSLINQERITLYQKREIAAGHTLVGPHKDDFIVNIQDPRHQVSQFNIAEYGSRGQQRLAVLWLKVGELAYIEQKTEQSATLLLDDILSELDVDSRHRVLTLLGERQTIITTTEPRIVEEVQALTASLQTINLAAL